MGTSFARFRWRARSNGLQSDRVDERSPSCVVFARSDRDGDSIDGERSSASPRSAARCSARVGPARRSRSRHSAPTHSKRWSSVRRRRSSRAARRQLNRRRALCLPDPIATAIQLTASSRRAHSLNASRTDLNFSRSRFALSWTFQVSAASEAPRSLSTAPRSRRSCTTSPKR